MIKKNRKNTNHPHPNKTHKFYCQEARKTGKRELRIINYLKKKLDCLHFCCVQQLFES